MSKRASDKEWRREIAKRFREAIYKRRLTNKRAAEILGVKRQTLWLYLNDKATPGGDVLRKACEEWGITINRKGVEFSSGAFGSSKQAGRSPMKAKQLSLFEALELLREAQLDTEVLGRTGQYF